MIDCLEKYFGIRKITREIEVNILKNLLFGTTIGEAKRLSAAGEFPACLGLLFNALEYSAETGQSDTIARIYDFMFNCKAEEEL